jgi:hypothetical protein
MKRQMKSYKCIFQHMKKKRYSEVGATQTKVGTSIFLSISKDIFG